MAKNKEVITVACDPDPRARPGEPHAQAGGGPVVCRVEVAPAGGSGQKTAHIVSIPPGYPKKLGREDEPLEELVRQTFRFLLARESNESIYREFELPVVAVFFPEYEEEMRKGR